MDNARKRKEDKKRQKEGQVQGGDAGRRKGQGHDKGESRGAKAAPRRHRKRMEAHWQEEGGMTTNRQRVRTQQTKARRSRGMRRTLFVRRFCPDEQQRRYALV